MLHLTLHDRTCAWKSIDWEAVGRLHERGLIGDPVRKQKAVAFTEEGLGGAKRFFRELFANA